MIKSTGYIVAAQSIVWTSGQALNSLTDNEWTDLSDEVDNTSTKYTVADIEVVLASAAFTGTDSTVEIYIIPTLDETNYPNWTGNDTTAHPQNMNYAVGEISTSGATAAQRGILSGVLLPPGKFKFGFRSRANVSLAVSGNSANWRPYSLQDAA